MTATPDTVENFINEYFTIPRCTEIIANCAAMYVTLANSYDATHNIDQTCRNIVEQAERDLWHTSGVNTFNLVLLRSVAQDVLDGHTKRPSTGNVRDYTLANYAAAIVA